MQIAEKTAVVTGGAVRIGRAIALALAEAEMNVCLHYGESREEAERTAAEIRELGRTATMVQADLRDPVRAAHKVIDHACAELGSADVLINSAAIFEPDALTKLDETQWDRQFAINLKAPAFLCREFVARLQPGQPGHIINIADWRALRPQPGSLSYTLTKSALVGLTRLLAQELGAHSVQVNAIAPGAILPATGEEENFDQLAEDIPLRRTGEPADIAGAVLYLVRSDFVTGEVLHVTGGQQL